MRFLIDAQLPPGLAHWLIRQGRAAEHVADLDLADAEDAAIWLKAKSLSAILITKDEDFVATSQ